jgi:hypothetical protein
VTADCPAGQACKNGQCELDTECGAQEFALETVAPNLLILLDRSCSMPECAKYGLIIIINCFNFSDVDKWGVAVDAITQLTSSFAGQVRWGLEFFPDSAGDNCVQDPPVVPLGDNTEADIQAVLADALDVADPNFPDGPCVTNINAAVQRASTDTTLQDPDRGNYLLLITDGMEAGCQGNDADTESILASLASSGVSTFVVGFGADVNPVVLDRFANAGGTPNPDPAIDYYQADDIDSLQTALSSIVGRIVGCDFQLDTVPEDPDQIYVWANDSISLPRDDPDGWRYDPSGNRLTFQGAACDDIQNGVTTDIDVVFGCNAPVIE